MQEREQECEEHEQECEECEEGEEECEEHEEECEECEECEQECEEHEQEHKECEWDSHSSHSSPSPQYNCRENQVGSINWEELEGGAREGWEYRPMRSMRSRGWQAFRSTTTERKRGGLEVREEWRVVDSPQYNHREMSGVEYRARR